MKKILICDADKSLHELLIPYYKKDHKHVVSQYSAKTARDYLTYFEIDLIVLDTNLPDENGLSFVKYLKKNYPDLPIILLSKDDSEIDRILGLEVGADDFISKPCYPREVILRSKKLMHRLSKASHSKSYSFQNLKINEQTLECRVEKEVVPFTVHEIRLLTYFISNPQIVLSREQLLSAVWDYEYAGESRTVDATVKRIRKKLSSYSCNFEIQTVYGAGYRLVCK